MRMLTTLTEETGCTIIMTVHQPELNVWKLIDDILVLKAGTLWDHAPADEMIEKHKGKCLSFFLPSSSFLCFLTSPFHIVFSSSPSFLTYNSQVGTRRDTCRRSSSSCNARRRKCRRRQRCQSGHRRQTLGT
jgi:ABC-type dipeptide/oligopeptide/nickel transport system ATPase component